MAGREGNFRLIAGLGNPGSKYAGTRHNAGFWLVDELVRRYGGELREESKFRGDCARVLIDGYDCRLVKPMTYMNHSGQAVGALANFFKIPPEAILVAHDEIDLPPGSVRLKRGGGHGGHNGLRHIQSTLGTAEFARLRIGVGHPGHKDQVVPHVLSRPAPDELRLLERAIDDAADEIPRLLAGEWDRACQQLHA
ncbi:MULTISPECIES: aminoacyl-tRNA hydrolase [Halorhodospira]|uniref:aminoacyl-tRNA hydrolase n=1 Tax=Halorhodospira TaxID=85108 RepID=UPI0019133598|nr:aminoacyl-tRNA hydrolase [Halorhodospira halophila]MCG5533153.1 aminoacyl-tRNA hydrolase [Halorhodospira sp. 9621]MCG5537907.1 aminoacyl-tRNA hydrolase [Halorhodospira sp. 9622]MCG5540689.1 aminoacyl-tRNA hydrolase [Halorhodospira sp. M39old]MCG5545984.1 aminoacyl-tRNA hydrolase [Halorhodospira sp. M38]